MLLQMKRYVKSFDFTCLVLQKTCAMRHVQHDAQQSNLKPKYKLCLAALCADMLPGHTSQVSTSYGHFISGFSLNFEPADLSHLHGMHYFLVCCRPALPVMTT